MRPFVVAAVVLVLLLLSAAIVKAYDRAPLFWQTEVRENSITVRRLHDAEAQVNCYLAYPADVDGDLLDRGQSKPLAMSCVKIR